MYFFSNYSSSGGAGGSGNNTGIPKKDSENKPVEHFRKDYKPLPYFVTKISMNFDIYDGKTTVTSELTVEPNKSLSDKAVGDLQLDGDEKSVQLKKLSLDGKDLKEGEDYTLASGKLIIKGSLLSETLSIIRSEVEIIPENNTQLSGLYKSGPMYCTQCEAMGFRRITYYPDRPDNMAVFENIRIEANNTHYPVLLSNGNLLESGQVENSDRHYAVWSDPFPKPSYLFCMVAGNLGSIKDSFTTMSGREIKLEIFSEKENVGKLHYAMDRLKSSMKWDEENFGLEYDLDLYNIVAVNDFNMGAMENKGLNIFNTSLVLADPATATDLDYENIERVIAHEYFHNWTGNRVTCRDWFQLTLKEGLTVFRDQIFSEDMGSKDVNRIEQVRALRARQFPEDAGPLSHPIRPESYISMDNFYTSTVYNKGSEIIRMYNTLLSKEGFRKGMDLYFERHDGAAVTCDDFRSAMADANAVDLGQFELWYSTPGTPIVKYSYSYDSVSNVFSLTLSQISKSDKPLHIPVSVGLIDKQSGKEVVPTKVLELKEMTTTFEFPNIQGDVVPSILRDFSAPVKLVSESGSDDEEVTAFLAARDSNGFNKWDAGQKLYTSLIFQTMRDNQSEKTIEYVLDAFKRTLLDKSIDDYSIKAYTLTLPGELTLAEELDIVDPAAIRNARNEVKNTIARKFHNEIKSLYDELTDDLKSNGNQVVIDSTFIGKRSLRNLLLDYLCSINESEEEQVAVAALASDHFNLATGMTDKVAGLQALVSMDGHGAEARDKAIKKFYDDAKGDALVLNKWFTIQAMADLPDVHEKVMALTEHPDFTLANPNRARSLLFAFTMNAAYFHDESGKGYQFIGDMVAKLDRLNPQICSRLAGSLINWKKYTEKRGELMKSQLKKLLAMKPISNDLFETVNRGLK